MSIFKTTIIAAALAALSPAMAEAASRSLNLTPQDFWVEGGASQGAGAVLLPDAGTPSLVANFILPRDYKADTPVRLRLVMFTTDACSINFELIAASRSRSGAVLYNSVQEYAFADGSTAESEGPSISFTKSLVIDPAPSWGGQKPGDGIALRIARDAGAINDTCDTVQLRHGEVRYTAK